MANVNSMISMGLNDDDTYCEVRHDETEEPGESTLSSDIEVDNLDNQQQVLYLYPVPHYETLWTTRVPLLKTQRHAATMIARTPLADLRHPPRAIALPLIKLQRQSWSY